MLLEGSRQSWRVLDSRELTLSPEGGKFARFPFHPLVELQGPAALTENRKATAAVRVKARQAMASLLGDLGRVDAAAIVGGSLTEPDRIHNPHMQVHAREAQLYREVVAAGLESASIAFEVLSDRDVIARLAGRCSTSEREISLSLTQSGRGRFRPWAAHQKLAAAGALWNLP